jgi:hypothetical protein
VWPLKNEKHGERFSNSVWRVVFRGGAVEVESQASKQLAARKRISLLVRGARRRW